MGDVKPPEKAPASEWLTCFCVVKFDIEIGQSMYSSLLIFHPKLFIRSIISYIYSPSFFTLYSPLAFLFFYSPFDSHLFKSLSYISLFDLSLTYTLLYFRSFGVYLSAHELYRRRSDQYVCFFIVTHLSLLRVVHILTSQRARKERRGKSKGDK